MLTGSLLRLPVIKVMNMEQSRCNADAKHIRHFLFMFAAFPVKPQVIVMAHTSYIIQMKTAVLVSCPWQMPVCSSPAYRNQRNVCPP